MTWEHYLILALALWVGVLWLFLRLNRSDAATAREQAQRAGSETQRLGRELATAREAYARAVARLSEWQATAAEADPEPEPAPRRRRAKAGAG